MVIIIKSERAFTLIELMVVVVIIGILAAIAIPNFIRMETRANEASVKAVAHTLQLAVEDYKTTPGWLGLKPENANDLNAVLQTNLPTNVQTKKNPFSQAETYGNGGGGIKFQPAPGGVGEISYNFFSETVQYTILAEGGGNGTLILTLEEGFNSN